jgi:hypothetical protein
VTVDTEESELILATIDCEVCAGKNMQYDFLSSESHEFVDPLKT